MKIAVSILGIKDRNNVEEIERLNPDYIHIDVMDSNFVDNYSFPINEVKPLVDNYKYDVHLMVENVEKYIDDFVEIKPDCITFHIEVGDTVNLINYVKNKGIKVGIAINPNTKVENIYPYLKDIDRVLIMSVEPGLGGQVFMMSSLDKINKLYEYRKDNNLSYEISVDGGINNDTIKLINKCDIAVIGSYITSGNYEERINSIRGII